MPTPTLDWANICGAPTELLKTLDNPLHIAIVNNYRRHYMLENAGRFAEIFTPEMIVEDLTYHISVGKLDAELSGTQKIYDLYSGFHFKSFPADEIVAVHDWGIATETRLIQHVSGAQLKALGLEFDKLEDRYLMRHWLGMVWPYSDKGLLIGEHSYHQRWSVEVEAIGPDYYEPTNEELADILNPVLAEQEPEWRASLLV